MIYGHGTVIHGSRSRGVIQGSFLGGRPVLPPARSGWASPRGSQQAFAPPPGFRLPPPAAGRPLPGPVQAALGGLLRMDLAGVRVHAGAEAVALRALAFSLGPELFFAPGQYSPETRAGLRLLGHELAHVLQQKRGQVPNPLPSGLAIVHDPALEAEATRIGLRAESLLAARPVQVAVPPSFRAAPRGPAAATVQPMEKKNVPHGRNVPQKRKRRSHETGSPSSPKQGRPNVPPLEELLREATLATPLLSFLSAPDRLRLRGVSTSARAAVETLYDPFAKARELGSARTGRPGSSSQRIRALARRAWAAIYWTLRSKRRGIPGYDKQENPGVPFAEIAAGQYWKVRAFAPFERGSEQQPTYSANELPADDPATRALLLGEGKKWERHYRRTPFLHAEIRLAELMELLDLTLPAGERFQVNKPCCLFCAGLLEAIGLSGRYPGAKLHSHKRYVFTKHVFYFRDRRRRFWGDFETIFDGLNPEEKQAVLAELAGLEVSSDQADQMARIWPLEPIPEAGKIPEEEEETPPIPRPPATPSPAPGLPFRKLPNRRRRPPGPGFQAPGPAAPKATASEPRAVSGGVDRERLDYIVTEAKKRVERRLERHGTWFGRLAPLDSIASKAESLLRKSPGESDDELARRLADQILEEIVPRSS